MPICTTFNTAMLLKSHKHPRTDDFLPELLAITERPAHPLPRIVLWTLALLATLTLLWAFFGHMDIVVSAQGKIIPSAYDKWVQPLGVARIKTIRVHEGEFVRKGQLLVELDPTTTQADLTKIQQTYFKSCLDVIRYNTLLQKIETPDATPQWPPSLGLTTQQRQEAERQFQQQWRAIQTELQQLNAQIDVVNGKIQMATAQLQKYEALLPMLSKKEQAYQMLFQKGYASEQEYTEVQREWIALTADIQVQKSQMIQLNAEKRAAQATGLNQRANIQKKLGEDAAQAHATEQQAYQEWIKAKQQLSLTRLTAPIDGIVEQLAIHTEGGVVTPAQQLMMIVPRDADIQVQATLDNTDVGFVQQGQIATVKIAAFPFTRYGALTGHVLSVSQESKEDPNTGQLRYTAYITLPQNALTIEEKKVPLLPGMQVTVDIQTGKRRVIDYFLNPLLQHINNALRER